MTQLHDYITSLLKEIQDLKQQLYEKSESTGTLIFKLPSGLNSINWSTYRGFKR